MHLFQSGIDKFLMTCKSYHTCHRWILFLHYEQSLYDSSGCTLFLASCHRFHNLQFLLVQPFYGYSCWVCTFWRLHSIFCSLDGYVTIQCVGIRPFICVNILPHSSQCSMLFCKSYFLPCVYPLPAAALYFSFNFSVGLWCWWASLVSLKSVFSFSLVFTAWKFFPSSLALSSFIFYLWCFLLNNCLISFLCFFAGIFTSKGRPEASGDIMTKSVLLLVLLKIEFLSKTHFHILYSWIALNLCEQY